MGVLCSITKELHSQSLASTLAEAQRYCPTACPASTLGLQHGVGLEPMRSTILKRAMRLTWLSCSPCWRVGLLLFPVGDASNPPALGANVDRSTLEAELRASKREVQSALQGLRLCKEEQCGLNTLACLDGTGGRLVETGCDCADVSARLCFGLT